MPSRSRALDDALRLSSRLRAAIAVELREALIAHGLSQAAVSKALGASRKYVSQVESAKVAVSVDYLVRHSAVLGLKPSIKLYPVGGGLRDAAQLRYIAKFIQRIGAAWRIRLDVPMPIAGDLRAVDVLLEGACVVAVEVVTHLRDDQALLRAAQLKQRDIGAPRLIIVVSGSHANRRAIAEARASLVATFDLDTHRTLTKLANGEDPGRDAIVVLD
jgi:transcriptional regulator with XRE-family HTH domain